MTQPPYPGPYPPPYQPPWPAPPGQPAQQQAPRQSGPQSQPGPQGQPWSDPSPYPHRPGPHQQGPGGPSWPHQAAPAPQSAPPHGPGRGRSLALLVAGLVAGAALGAGVVAAVQRPATKKLDPAAVAKGVSTVLTGSYHMAKPSGVTCPAGMTTKPGNRYTCSFQLGGVAHTVPITVQNNAGQYQVGAPK